MAVVLAPRVRREREREMAQVERARRKVEEQREDEATALPTAERVAEMVRAALAPHLRNAVDVRLRRTAAHGETVTATLIAVYGHGVLLRTERGMPVWVSYRDLFCDHAAVLAPVHVHGSVQRAVSRLRSAAPNPHGGGMV